MHGALRAHFEVENTVAVAVDDVSKVLSNLFGDLFCKFPHQGVGAVQAINLFLVFIMLLSY